MDLRNLGFDARFADAFAALGRGDLVPGRVIKEDRLGYLVATEKGEKVAELPQGKRHAARDRGALPAVGDWVGLEPADARGKATVQAVLPRRSKFSRKVVGDKLVEQVVAANVDTVFIVMGLDGDFNVRRIERYLTLAHDSGTTPVILLNKADLCEEPDAKRREVCAVAPGVDVHVVVASRGEGIDVVTERMGAGRTVAFLGSSGVGKSTLVNALVGEARMETAAVRDHDSRGRHTTSFRELIEVPGGGSVIDTPGMRELQLWANPGQLRGGFPEICELASQCRFRDCRHGVEPGCAVHGAVAAGALDPDRLGSFVALRAEIERLGAKRGHRRRGG